MTRQEALDLVNSHVSSSNLVKHMLAVEAVMKKLARRLGGDEEQWGLAGLVHDLDYDYTSKDPARHGLMAVEMLSDKGLPAEVLRAIRSHVNHAEAVSAMDKAIIAADPVTGLIVASALMHPTKKLRNVDLSFVLNRFKEKSFARGANREQIKTCSTLGLELEEFLALSLEAMSEIDAELGL
ncbi:MAG: HDIG domain-containing protein [Candidatus Eisenbacteria bacterium]|nr:HDIG domain-containing protein [Candidatus Eisenbacteria bacterium]